MRRILPAICLVVTCQFFTGMALASDTTPALPYFPGSQYNTAVPTVEQALGYALGSRVTEPAAVLDYFRQLQQAAPDRLKLVQYGKSAQGRPLFYVVIGKPAHLSALDQIETDMRRLADPRTLTNQSAEQLLQNLPSSVWVSSTLHGNEISPVDAAMALAYFLLAEQSGKAAHILDNTLVYIEPLQNPDGHHRFVSRYYATAGLVHSADRFSAEHNEPWPNGRTNHYLFDMNRDWLALTQPEIQQRVKRLQQMFPLVYVDSHEMGGDQSYYFSPEAEPYNPFILASQRETLQWFGQNNAKKFDELGYDYFTREIFDAFFPGYGASWPLYHGSIAMTYEMGSARGHAYRKQDGSVVTFADGVQRNFIAYTATLETAATKRKELLQRFYQYRQQALKQGNKDGIGSYIFPASRDKAGHQKLMGVLTQHGIRVEQAQEDFRACGQSYQAGAYLVNTAQPTYQLIRAVLDDSVPMDAKFIKQQEERRANNLPDQIYDVTAWSLPQMYNLTVNRCSSAVEVSAAAVGPETLIPGQVSQPDAAYGYLVPWGDMAAARLMSAALQQGFKVKSADVAFTHQNGKQYPAGTLILSKADNPGLAEKIGELAGRSGAQVEGISNSWVLDGPNFGSGQVKLIPKVNIAMAWDEPTDPLSAGSARFVLERFIGYPVTAMRPAQMLQSALQGYDVLILPSSRAGYQNALGERGQQLLRQFVQRGGVLIALGNANEWLLQGKEPLLASKQEFKTSERKKPLDKTQVPGTLLKAESDYQKLLEPWQADPDWVPGFMANARVDQNHWLTAAVPPQVKTIYVGNQIYTPLSIDQGRNVVTFDSADKVLAGGFVWDENRLQIAQKAVVMVQELGRGQIIAFTQEPNFRAYVDGMHLLYINAVFRGAANASPLR